MMWFFALVVVLLIGAVAVVASGRWGGMSDAYDDRPDMRVPARRPLTAADIQGSRFAIGLRGYRMDEVDTLLERVAAETAERDRRIADLERALRPIARGPGGAAFAADPPPAGAPARYDESVATHPGQVPFRAAEDAGAADDGREHPGRAAEHRAERPAERNAERPAERNAERPA